tara:strand:+ start:1684 stop:2277 length:594 start_codon:yes stop_codon:yes gene_type:complete
MDTKRKNTNPRVPGPRPGMPDRKTSPISWLIESIVKLGGTAAASKVVDTVYNFYENRDFNPIKAGKDYQTKGTTMYPKSDAPMSGITGQTTYDMAERGVENEVINKPPMTGDRKMTKYKMPPKPAMANVNTKTTTAPIANYETNDPTKVDVIDNDRVPYTTEEANKELFKELSFEDINKIEDFETRTKRKSVSEIGY